MNQEELAQTIVEFYNEPFIRNILDTFDEKMVLDQLPDHENSHKQKSALFKKIQDDVGYNTIDDFDSCCQYITNIEKEVYFIFGIKMGHILSKLGRNKESPNILLSSKID